MKTVKIILTCPNCGNSTWLEQEAGDFRCLACDDVYAFGDMCQEIKPIKE